MEISQASINNSTVETKSKLTDDICRLLQVREKNEAMQKDWLLFITTSNFRITAGEIYLAFKMALSREILDDKGNEIDLFPELSNNATGKVISAYLRYKSQNDQYTKAKEDLKKLNLPSNVITEEEKKKIRDNFLKVIFDDLVKDGFSGDAWQLFFDLEIKKRIIVSTEEKKKLYDEELKKYIPAHKEEIKLRGSFSAKSLLKEFQSTLDSGKNIAVVQNRCRSIIVSKYLKEHSTDFETFKKAIEYEK